MSQAIIIFQWVPELLTLVWQTLRNLAATGADSIRWLKITLRSRFCAGTWSANAERCHEQYLAPTPRCSASVLAEHLRIYQNVELNGVQSVFFKLPSGVFFPKKSFQKCFTLSAFIRWILCVKLLSSSVSSWCLCLRGELFLTSAAFAARLSLFEIKNTLSVSVLHFSSLLLRKCISGMILICLWLIRFLHLSCLPVCLFLKSTWCL